MEAVLIVLIVFGSIASLFIVPSYLRSQERQKLQDTLRAAIEKGQTLPPEVIEAMSSHVKLKPPPSPQRDMRTGVIWLFVALGVAAFGWVLGFAEPDATFPMLAIATFPGFIGAAFIVIALIGRRKS
ncbi:DUF6249 domain-containing protein [Phenylobacterium sp.]|uniref:DUF6249 domain-containing protein n=1 Tax=Phenylobacterium sp. TaxID=1871053 RepID=UPI0035AF40A9